jgi:tRNA pseudouridine38-40 synthase
MVRNLVGTLAAVGGGELTAEEAVAILERRDRTAAGVTAPAAGLKLVDVSYPPHYGLPRYVDDP